VNMLTLLVEGSMNSLNLVMLGYYAAIYRAFSVIPHVFYIFPDDSDFCDF